MIAGCAPAAPAVTEPQVDEGVVVPVSGADLQAVKTYAQENAADMKTGAQAMLATAEAYYALIESEGFDYEVAWANQPDELAQLVADARDQWLIASQYYELNEGIVAGVPVLSEFDVLLDAGPSGEEDPNEALDWTLDLPNGEQLAQPGNYFHSLLEPTLWGTKPEFTGAQVDLDGDGEVSVGEALPDANVFLGTAQGFDQAASDLIAAVDAWNPTMEDAFTALAVMIPTMSEYFEQWKLSAFIAGEDYEETAFIGASRLFDIVNILHGLKLTYDNISPEVQATNDQLHQQILTGFEQLSGYVNDLYEREQQGERFSAEQADLFGTEAQNRATQLVGQVVQAAALLNISIAGE
jgi:hypothetical protein